MALPQAPCGSSSRTMQRDAIKLQDSAQDLKSGLDPKQGFCFNSLQRKSQITSSVSRFDSALC